jgi:uncharacterized protein (TIGR02118 family)
MHRLHTFYAPPSDSDAFRAHFEGTHLPLVEKLPGLRGYSYGFDLTAVDGGESLYFCTFEGDFDNARALDAALASPAGRAVAADVPNYATGGVVLLRYDVRDAAYDRAEPPPQSGDDPAS